MKRIPVVIIVFLMAFLSFTVFAQSDFSNAIIGDINGDKEVNSIDFIYLRQYILGKIDKFPVESGFYCADIDGNNEVNVFDFAWLRKYLLGQIKDLSSIRGDTDTDISSPTPINAEITPTPTVNPFMNRVTYYYVNNIKVNNNPGVEIYVEKSSTDGVRVSAYTACTAPPYADGWIRTYFRLEGSAVNGVDYEEINFDYFWRELGTGFDMNLGDDNPRRAFYIKPIDTGTDKTKDLKIYFDGSTEPAAIIYFVKSK